MAECSFQQLARYCGVVLSEDPSMPRNIWRPKSQENAVAVPGRKKNAQQGGVFLQIKRRHCQDMGESRWDMREKGRCVLKHEVGGPREHMQDSVHGAKAVV